MSCGSVAEADRLAMGWVPEQVFGTTPAVINLGAEITYSMDATDNSINDSASGFVTDGFVAGMIIRVAGFTETQSNATYIIVSVAAGKMVLGDNNVVTEIAGDSVTIIANAMQSQRYNTENFRQDTTSTESAEVDPTAQVTDIVRTGVTAPGDLNFEFSSKGFDEWIKSCLRADTEWGAPIIDISVAATISFTAPDQIDDSGNGLATYVVNEWIRVTSAGSGLNSGFYKVATVAAGSITVDQQSITTEAAGPAGNVTIEQGGSITNGVTCRSYSWEGDFTDLSDIYKIFRAAVPNGLTLTIPDEGIITGTLSFMGKQEQSGVAKLNGTNIAAFTNDVMNTIDDVELIYENTAAYSVTGVTLATASNIRQRKNVGSVGADSAGLGKFNSTGTHTAFFATHAVMDAYLAFTERPFAVVMLDDDGYGYVFDWPAIKYTSGQRVGGGVNTDIIADMGWSAKKHGTEGIMLRVSRFGWAA